MSTSRPDEHAHRAIATWAADCAEHVLELFEDEHPDDDRPRAAIQAARVWVRGDLPMVEAREAAFAAHAAARDAANEAAIAAARAAGHAAATAHVADHAWSAADYAVKAAGAAAAREDAGAAERAWQERRLPDGLRPEE